MFVRKLGIWVAALLVLIAIAGVPVATAFTIDGYTFAAGTEHTITGVAADKNYFTINFTLSNATGDNADNTIYTDGLTAPDWRDVRFTDDNNAIQPHWIESTTATTAFVWVNVTSIPTAGTVIRCYYDSDDAPQASSITATFPFADDFDDGSLDTTTRWTLSGSPSVSEANGLMTVSYTTDGNRWVDGKTVFGLGYAYRSRSKLGSLVSSNTYYGLGTRTPSTSGLYAMANTGRRFASYYSSTYQYDAVNSDTDWNVDDIARISGTSTAYRRNNTLAWSNANSVSTGNYAVTMRSATAGMTIQHDWILIRPYLVTEPAHAEYVEMNPPVAAFSADVTSGDAPLSVTFTDASTGSPTSWAWDFDNDGNTDSTAQNPSYEYPAAGTYTAKLTAANAYGSDDETKTDYITVSQPYDPPGAAFSANDTSGYAPLPVSFTDSSTGPPTAWTWDFDGDGGTDSTDQNATHVYADPGTYTVNLTVTNPTGTDSEVKAGYITVVALPAPPVASFTADTTSGHAPLTVHFTDTSTGSPSAWAWDFDGDNVADSTDQNPTYEYAANGTYTVKFEAWNDGGSNLTTRTDYIYVGALTARLLRASFTFDTAMGTAPFSVAFADTSASNGTYARAWDFGDGETSTEPAPVHEYATAGKYDVELVITSDYTQDKSAARKAVMAYPAAAVSPLPTTTFGAHMTEIMESNWNVSVIGPIIPRAYTDALTPLAGDTGVGNMIFWGIIWVGVFMILFLRQGTPWLAALVGLIAGPGILTFLPPEWAHVGYICLAVTIGCSFFVIALGRFRST